MNIIELPKNIENSEDWENCIVFPNHLKVPYKTKIEKKIVNYMVKKYPALMDDSIDITIENLITELGLIWFRQTQDSIKILYDDLSKFQKLKDKSVFKDWQIDYDKNTFTPNLRNNNELCFNNKHHVGIIQAMDKNYLQKCKKKLTQLKLDFVKSLESLNLKLIKCWYGSYEIRDLENQTIYKCYYKFKGPKYSLPILDEYEGVKYLEKQIKNTLEVIISLPPKNYKYINYILDSHGIIISHYHTPETQDKDVLTFLKLYHLAH